MNFVCNLGPNLLNYLKEQQPAATAPPAKKPRIEKSCFFSQLRKSAYEHRDRPVKSEVSLDCEGDEESLTKYSDTSIDQRTGATNALSLLLCRGAGECDLDFSNPATIEKWKDVKICAHHANELLLKWGDTKGFKNKHIMYNKGDVCSMPEEICPTHNGRPATHLRILTVKESNLILKQYGILVHPGIPICHKHGEEVDALKETKTTISHEKTKYQNNPETSKTCDKSSYHYPGESVKDETALALQKFTDKIGVKRVCYPNKPFINLREDSQRKKVCSLKQVIDAAAEIMAPSYSSELKRMVFKKYEDEEMWSIGSTKELDKLLKQMSLHFLSAENRQEKLIILGLVANSVPLSKIQQYLPNLSSGFVPTLTTADQEKKSVLQGEITQFWYYSSCVKSKSCGPEPDTASPEIDDQLRNDAEIGNVYACPEPGCSATFLKSSNLDYHVLKDQHKKSPEKVTMRDYALNLFSNFLENVQKEHTAEFVSNALNQFEESIIPTNLAVGHSLPEKKTNKPFGTKVTSWLKGLFDEGLKKKAKPHDPTVVAQRMMTERNADGSLMFSGEELKTTSQISGYFKREAEKRRNKSAAKREAPTESTKKVEELDYTPDEEEHPEAGLARWVKDEAFQPIADRIMHAILQDNYFAHPVVQNVPKA
ncbi:unnamed protein product [Caenorhabditis brenneri]